MERCLCLLLGKEPDYNEINYIKLTEYMSSNKLDEFIISNFANSEQVRKYYAERINKFLTDNDRYLQKIYMETGRKYRGSIVILEKVFSSYPKKIKVLYSNIKSNLDQILSNESFIKYLAQNQRTASKVKLFSGFQRDIFSDHIFYPKAEKKVILKQWKASLPKTNCIYEKIRQILKNYDEYLKQYRQTSIKKEPLKDEVVPNLQHISFKTESNVIDPDSIFLPDLDHNSTISEEFIEQEQERFKRYLLSAKKTN